MPTHVDRRYERLYLADIHKRWDEATTNKMGVKGLQLKTLNLYVQGTLSLLPDVTELKVPDNANVPAEVMLLDDDPDPAPEIRVVAWPPQASRFVEEVKALGELDGRVVKLTGGVLQENKVI